MKLGRDFYLRQKKRILNRNFYLQPTLEVAQKLLGKYLVFGKKAGKIIETEAYIGENDKACHASRGRTKRTETMFRKGGHSYIYMIYGMYFCLNIVTEKEGFPAAVLIRALDLPNTNGPGRLCREFGLNLDHNGIDLQGKDLYIEDRGEVINPKNIIKAPRIGVSYAGADAKKPWRFMLK